MARTRKERDWNYYKPFLQQYCLGNLSYSDKIPPHAAYYQRKFFAPGENVNRGTGSITLFDPTNPREGHQLTMWKDWSDPMGKAGDIYALVMKNEHIQTRWEAYDRCEDLFGPAKHVVRTQAVRKRNRAMRYKKRESAFKLTNEQIALEDAKCREQRREIEAQVIENVKETGCLFKSLRHMPCQVGHDRKGELVYHNMTCANYMYAMILDNADPRYISERDAKKEGWRIKDGAKPVTFEYLDTKSSPYHLMRWQLYNGADVIGMPPYKARPVTPERDVLDNIRIMLRGNGITDDNTVLFDNPIEKLRDLAAESTWHEAKVLGQRTLERELVMTQLMQQCGASQYKLADVKPVLEHLERDFERKGCENLFKSGYRMDLAVRGITGKYTDQLLRDTLEQTRAFQAAEKAPFKELRVYMASDFKLPGDDGFIPKGAALEGERAYKALAAILREDMRLFGRSDDPAFGREVSLYINLRNDGIKGRISLPLGHLAAGNRGTVSESIAELLLKPDKDKVFTNGGRETAVGERVRLQIFNSPECKRRLEENPTLYKEQVMGEIEKEFMVKEAAVLKKMESFAAEESQYMKHHPELSLGKDRADTYLYRIPSNMCQDEKEVLRTFGSDMIVNIRRPDFYGKEMDGYVIETRGALVSDGQGRFLSLASLSKGSEVAAEPFLKENEAKKHQEFETKFEISITDTAGEERYKGETARQCLAYLMMDDRDMYERQKSGMKPVELSQRQHVTVRFGDQVLMDEDVYLGQLKLGNYTSVYDMLEARCKDRQSLRDLYGGLHVSEKYTVNPELLDILQSYQQVPQELIDQDLEREFLPEGMESSRPRVGQKASVAMQWYKAKALVNYCHTEREITDHIVADMARKYKAETIERVIKTHLPELKNCVHQSLERPEIQKTIKENRERNAMRLGKVVNK